MLGKILDVINSVASKSKRGSKPLFDRVYVFLVLIMLSEGTISRYRLMRELGLSEATARTILAHLKKFGIIRVRKKRTVLSKKGAIIVNKIASFLRKANIRIDLGYSLYYGFILKNLAKYLKDILAIRDEVVRGGAKGALILIKKEGKIISPGVEWEWASDTIDMDDGDLAIVAFDDDAIKTKYSAAKGVLTFIENLYSNNISL